MEDKKVDCTEDVMAHKSEVNNTIALFMAELLKRAANHDLSKLTDPVEKDCFDRCTWKLKEMEYGSKEYKESCTEMRTGIVQHYKNNDHHMEYHGYHNNNTTNMCHMNLFSFIEMFADWCAASKRSKNGNLEKSLEENASRFELPWEVVGLFENTIKYMDEIMPKKFDPHLERIMQNLKENIIFYFKHYTLSNNTTLSDYQKIIEIMGATNIEDEESIPDLNQDDIPRPYYDNEIGPEQNEILPEEDTKENE